MDKKPRLRYHKGRYKEMTIRLAAQNWAELDQTNVEEIFEDAIHQFIPTSKPSKDRRKKLWMNRQAL